MCCYSVNGKDIDQNKCIDGITINILRADAFSLISAGSKLDTSTINGSSNYYWGTIGNRSSRKNTADGSWPHTNMDFSVGKVIITGKGVLGLKSYQRQTKFKALVLRPQICVGVGQVSLHCPCSGGANFFAGVQLCSRSNGGLGLWYHLTRPTKNSPPMERKGLVFVSLKSTFFSFGCTRVDFFLHILMRNSSLLQHSPRIVRGATGNFFCSLFYGQPSD